MESDIEWMKKVAEENKKLIWDVEQTCIQELYSEICFNMHFEFCHNGHNYFITFDEDKDENQLWVIYDRDYSDPKVAYKCNWDIEPRTDYKDLPSLIFEYKLKNDGRTIAEYCCDYWKQPRLLVPEPVAKNAGTKIWRH